VREELSVGLFARAPVSGSILELQTVSGLKLQDPHTADYELATDAIS